MIIDHDVDMDVTVTGMAEASDGQTMFLLQPRCETEQVLKAAARHDDVLIELDQAGVPQRPGKLTPDLPNLFTLAITQATLDE